MKKLILILMASAAPTFFLFAQQKEQAEKLVMAGIALHDDGEYGAAIAKYEEALELDKDNLLALAETALTYMALKKYEDAIEYCKKNIGAHPADKSLESVYVVYGNALDILKKPGESIKVYDEGIALFPDYYHLHFNKGVSLSGMRLDKEAAEAFQKAALCNPNHASSHNAIASLANKEGNKIAALLAYCRFFVVEPQSGRAQGNLDELRGILKGNIKQTGEKSYSIDLKVETITGMATEIKGKTDDFVSTFLTLSLVSALDADKKYKKENERERFVRKMETVCASLAEAQKTGKGFFWEYYAPYLIEMQSKNFLKTFSYVVFVSSGDKATMKWIKSHESELNAFFEWSKAYRWKTI